MKGDFGHSTFTGQPVLTAILERLPVTLELTAISVLFALVVGIPLGIQAAVRRNRWMDYLATVFGLSGISIPGFWLGTLLILLFSLKWGWFPSGGYVAIWEDPLGNLQTMAMPGIALGTAVAAVVMRITRSSMLEVLDQEYIKMARIKGAPERIVVRRHALRNALIPVVTVLGIQVGYLLGGSVVIEQIFSLPGVGQLGLAGDHQPRLRAAAGQHPVYRGLFRGDQSAGRPAVYPDPSADSVLTLPRRTQKGGKSCGRSGYVCAKTGWRWPDWS